MKLIQALVMAHQEFDRYQQWVIRHGYDGPILEKRIFDYFCFWPEPEQQKHTPKYFAVDSRLEAALSKLAEKYPYEVTSGEAWQIARSLDKLTPGGC